MAECRQLLQIKVAASESVETFVDSAEDVVFALVPHVRRSHGASGSRLAHKLAGCFPQRLLPGVVSKSRAWRMMLSRQSVHRFQFDISACSNAGLLHCVVFETSSEHLFSA